MNSLQGTNLRHIHFLRVQARLVRIGFIVGVAIFLCLGIAIAAWENRSPSETKSSAWTLTLRKRIEVQPATGQFAPKTESVRWDPSRTAVIICDVWDYHHSVNAYRRGLELAPRINDFVIQARASGATIIHAPSDCMEAYADHPARLRASVAGTELSPPPNAANWNHCLPSERDAEYPVDQSDGGADDQPDEQLAWSYQLQAMGRNPSMPWKAQSGSILIDSESDYISDRGDEVWRIIESRGIEQVILVGVHTNMCVIGRPFGLRQFVSWKKPVVLVRDLTDTMYNPKRWPFVSHFTGTDLVVNYIEQHVCPTITSDQIMGGKPFRFSRDTRLTLAMLISEDEYETNRTLPDFARRYLGTDFRVVMLHGTTQAPQHFVDLSELASADALLVSVRRRQLPIGEMKYIREFVRAGKPVLGIRTASHAFASREPAASADGWEFWPSFDAEVFGGNYTGHFGNDAQPTIHICSELVGGSQNELGSTELPSNGSPAKLLAGCDFKDFVSQGSLYKTLPLSSSAKPILSGEVANESPQPVAWTYVRADGGRSFYTSLGHKSDFDNPAFQKLLLNAIYWSIDGVAPLDLGADPAKSNEYWRTAVVPGDPPVAVESATAVTGWARCYLKFSGKAPMGMFWKGSTSTSVWVNGQRCLKAKLAETEIFQFPESAWIEDETNLLVVRWDPEEAKVWNAHVPLLMFSDSEHSLSGRWQFIYGRDESFSNIPLPPKFGGSANCIFEF